LNSERDIFDTKRFPLLEYQEENLYFDKLNLNELFKQHKTPLFIFSQKILQLQFEKIHKAFSSLNTRSLKIAFSVKSNPLPEVAKTFMDIGGYFEVTSIGELKHINAIGGNFKSQEISISKNRLPSLTNSPKPKNEERI